MATKNSMTKSTKRLDLAEMRARMLREGFVSQNVKVISPLLPKGSVTISKLSEPVENKLKSIATLFRGIDKIGINEKTEKTPDAVGVALAPKTFITGASIADELELLTIGNELYDSSLDEEIEPEEIPQPTQIDTNSNRISQKV